MCPSVFVWWGGGRSSHLFLPTASTPKPSAPLMLQPNTVVFLAAFALAVLVAPILARRTQVPSITIFLLLGLATQLTTGVRSPPSLDIVHDAALGARRTRESASHGFPSPSRARAPLVRCAATLTPLVPARVSQLASPSRPGASCCWSSCGRTRARLPASPSASPVRPAPLSTTRLLLHQPLPLCSLSVHLSAHIPAHPCAPDTCGSYDPRARLQRLPRRHLAPAAAHPRALARAHAAANRLARETTRRRLHRHRSADEWRCRRAGPARRSRQRSDDVHAATAAGARVPIHRRHHRQHDHHTAKAAARTATSAASAAAAAAAAAASAAAAAAAVALTVAAGKGERWRRRERACRRRQGQRAQASAARGGPCSCCWPRRRWRGRGRGRWRRRRGRGRQADDASELGEETEHESSRGGSRDVCYKRCADRGELSGDQRDGRRRRRRRRWRRRWRWRWRWRWRRRRKR